MRITNVSSGVRTIAATGQTVAPDETAEVPDDLGRSLCDQPDVWRKTKPATAKPTDAGDAGKDDDQ